MNSVCVFDLGFARLKQLQSIHQLREPKFEEFGVG